MVNRPSEIARADGTTRIRLEEIFGDGEFKDNMQHVIATGRKMHIFDAEISICGITHSVNYFIAPCGGKSGEDEGPFIDKERFSGCAAAFNSLSVNDGDFVIFLEDITSFRRQSAAMSRALPAVPARRLIASESTFQPYYAALVAGAERKLTVVRVSFECDIVDEEWGSNMPSIVEMTNEFFALTNDVLEAEGGMRVGR